MKKVGLFLVGLVLVVSFARIAVTISDSSYDRMADVNRDRAVDVNDLSRLGKAYGSNLVLPTEPGKVVVTVLSFDREPPEVENARVAIIDPEVCGDAVNVTYTNSLGIATFELGPSKNYTTIAWYESAYNYANFTTNSFGEASILILLGEPTLPSICALPPGWVVMILLNETGALIPSDWFFACMISRIVGFTGSAFVSEPWAYLLLQKGVSVIPPSYLVNDPHSSWGIFVGDSSDMYHGIGVYSPDWNGCANVILTVKYSPG